MRTARIQFPNLTDKPFPTVRPSVNQHGLAGSVIRRRTQHVPWIYPLRRFLYIFIYTTACCPILSILSVRRQQFRQMPVYACAQTSRDFLSGVYGVTWSRTHRPLLYVLLYLLYLIVLLNWTNCVEFRVALCHHYIVALKTILVWTTKK